MSEQELAYLKGFVDLDDAESMKKALVWLAETIIEWDLTTELQRIEYDCLKETGDWSEHSADWGMMDIYTSAVVHQVEASAQS